MNRLLTALFLALLIAVPGYAQTITASLEGIVRDPSGGVIQGARARIVDTGTNATVEVTTDVNGQNFGNLGRGFGRITSQANSPRQVQVAVKLLF